MRKKSKRKKVWIASVQLGWVLLFALVEIFFFDSSLLDGVIKNQLPTNLPNFNSLKTMLEIAVVLLGVSFEFFRFNLLQKKLEKKERKRSKATIRRRVILRRVRA